MSKQRVIKSVLRASRNYMECATADAPLTADDIILLLNLKYLRPKDVYEHLRHIAKTVRAQSNSAEMLVMIPPSCKSCGYTFTDLNKPKKPVNALNVRARRYHNQLLR